MEVTGKIIHVLPPQSGISKNGNTWRKREYVLETQESYPKKIFFDFFGDRADQFPLEGGDMIKLSFDIESREYQGRWYTSIRAWKAEKVGEGQETMTQPQGASVQDFPGTSTYGQPTPPPDIDNSPVDDLPF